MRLFGNNLPHSDGPAPACMFTKALKELSSPLATAPFRMRHLSLGLLALSLFSLALGQDTSLAEVKKAFDDANVRIFTALSSY